MKHEISYRVPYADTDQMGVVYYANYLVYFERSRTEMLRSVNLPYSEMEQKGFFLPVAEAHCKYLSSAHYDEMLTFKSYIREMRGVRMIIASEVWRDQQLLVSGYVVLASVNNAKKVVRLPQELIEKCAVFLENNESEASK